MNHAEPSRFSQIDPRDFAAAMAAKGVAIDHGLAITRLSARSGPLPEQLRSLYRHFPWRPATAWADLSIQVVPEGRLARMGRDPRVRLYCDGSPVLDPFASDLAFPLFEWGCNWLIGQRMNDVLLLHAGVVERDGRALVLPALPGSGKSTLTAALSLAGWRLLSDEFGAFVPTVGQFKAVLKPIALKNQSIDVIHSFSHGAEMGPVYSKTHKGTVAHVVVSAEAVDRRHEAALPGAIVLPKWIDGAETRFEPLPPQRAFCALAFNAFNYAVMGRVGFRAVVTLVRQCPAWQLIYSDLEEALHVLDRMWRELPPLQAQAQLGKSHQAAAPALSIP